MGLFDCRCINHSDKELLLGILDSHIEEEMEHSEMFSHRSKDGPTFGTLFKQAKRIRQEIANTDECDTAQLALDRMTHEETYNECVARELRGVTGGGRGAVKLRFTEAAFKCAHLKEAHGETVAQIHNRLNTGWEKAKQKERTVRDVREAIHEAYVKGGGYVPEKKTIDFAGGQEAVQRLGTEPGEGFEEEFINDFGKGDVIVLKPPFAEKVNYIKRIIALPGESVEVKNGVTYVYTIGGG